MLSASSRRCQCRWANSWTAREQNETLLTPQATQAPTGWVTYAPGFSIRYRDQRAVALKATLDVGGPDRLDYGLRRDVAINFQGIETLLEAVRAEQAAALGARDEDGYTLLHLAVKPKPFSSGADPVVDRPALTRLLLAQPGIQVDACNDAEQTPLDCYRQPEMKKHLRALGGKTGKTVRKQNIGPSVWTEYILRNISYVLCRRSSAGAFLFFRGGDLVATRRC